MTEKFVLPRSYALEFADSIPFIRIDLKFIVSFKSGFMCGDLLATKILAGARQFGRFGLFLKNLADS